jgi:hypothetical protein
VNLSLFGAPAIEHGGKSHALDFERRTQRLAYLALKRAWVGRAEVAALGPILEDVNGKPS